jgi:zinc metalloprotease ZmpB
MKFEISSLSVSVIVIITCLDRRVGIITLANYHIIFLLMPYLMPRLLTIASLLLTSYLGAQKPNIAHPATIAPDRTEAPWHMEGNRQVNDLNGFATAIFQEKYVPQASEPEAIAREYLMANRAVLGLSPADISNNLRLHAVRTSETGHTVRLRQYWMGLPVNHNAEITVHVRHNREVDMVLSGFVHGVNLQAVTPTLSSEQAQAVVMAHLGFTNPLERQQSGLMVWHYERKSYLVHHLNFNVQGITGEWDAYVNATTGEIHKVEDVNFYYHHGEHHHHGCHHNEPPLPNLPYIGLTAPTVVATGTGNVFNPDPLSSAVAAYGGSYVDGADANAAVLTAQLQNVTLNDIELTAGVYKLAGPYAEIQDFDSPLKGLFTQSTSTFNFDRSADAFEAVNCYYHIDNMMRYLSVTLGLGTNVLPYQYTTGVRFDPSGANGADNSYYTSGAGRVSFGEGGVDDAEDADVIIHELGHGLHDWITVGGLSQVNGLSEGTGDYLAGSYSRHIGYWPTTNPAYHWTFNWDGHNPFWGGRALNYTPIYPGGLVGQIHADGQIWATANMKIWDDIGRQAADKAFWLGLDVTNSSTNQSQAANAVYTASINLGYTYAQRLAIHTRYVAAGYTMPAAPLPVELTRFDAKRTGDAAILTWTTASEDQNEYFTLERSADGIRFEPIAQIKGAGESRIERQYSYTDRQPINGINYYRLQQSDFDGRTSYSQVVSVRFDAKSPLALYPNPVSQDLTVAHSLEAGEVSIFDANGLLVRKVFFDDNEAKSGTRINIETLPTGTYWIQVIGDGQVLNGSVFKK